MKQQIEALIEQVKRVEKERAEDPARIRAVLAEVVEGLAGWQFLLEERVEQRARELATARDQRCGAARKTSLATLAAGLAHQVNNPVGAILLLARNALEAAGEPDADELRDRAFHRIIQNCKRCRELTQKVRQLAAAAPQKRRSNLSSLVRSAVDLTSEYARDEGAALELELAENLPPVEVSATGMEQVFADLIRNAIESGARTVRIRTEVAADAVRCRVEDDGGGMPEEVRQRIFDPFFTTRVHSGGIGLGLSIAHAVVTAIGGRIEVHSAPGRGTTVIVSLPAAASNS